MYAFQKVGLIQRESYLPLGYLKGRIIKKGGFIGGEGIHPGYGLPILVGIFVPKSMKSMHIFARLQQESELARYGLYVRFRQAFLACHSQSAGLCALRRPHDEVLTYQGPSPPQGGPVGPSES